ncbi:hypothetical protein FRB97_009361, partial [Tulasnella sp. 331]
MLLVQQNQSTGNTNPLIPVSPEKPSQPPLNGKALFFWFDLRNHYHLIKLRYVEDFASMEPSPPVLLVPQTQSTEHTTSSAAASPEKQPHLPSKGRSLTVRFDLINPFHLTDSHCSVGSASASERAPVLLVAQTRSTESTTPSAPVSPEKSSGLLGSGTDRLNAPIEIMVTKTLIVRSDGDVIPEQQIVTDSSQPREYGNEIDEYSEEELLAQMDEEDRSSAIAHSPIASQQGTPSPSPSPTSEPEPVLSRAVAILSAPNDHHLSNTTSPLLAPVAAPISLQTSPQPTTTKTTLEAPKLPTRFSFTSMAGPATPSPLPLPPSPSPGTLLQATRLGRARGSWALAPFVHPPSSPSPQKPQSNKRMRGSSESPIAGYPIYGDSSSSLTPATKGLMMVSTTTPTSGEAEGSPTASKRQRRFATDSPVLSASPLPPGAVKWASELYGENNDNIQQDQLTTTTTTPPRPRPTTLFVDLATQAPPLESDGLSQAYSQWDGLSPGIADGSINDELS